MNGTGQDRNGENAAATPGASKLPTFVFTDIVGSTRLWERHPEAMRSAIAEHDAMLRDVFEQHVGRVFATAGDSLGVVFQSPEYAVRAAIAAQYALARHDWGPIGAIQVRIGIHTGDAQMRDGDYFGLNVSRCARLMSIAGAGQIVISATTYDLVAGGLPAGIDLVPRGEHRLKDLSVPEHVFQVTHPSIESPLTQLQSLSAYDHNLPVQVSSFVGREREMSEVRRLLHAGRLVTLTGPGGGGKSRLALHASADMIGDFADGVWWVDLAEVSATGLVAQTVAAAMSLQGSPDVDMLEAVCRQLRQRRVLILLDNCEHLIDECASLVSRMLASCSALKMLVTSRELLRIDGEAALPIEPLAVVAHEPAAETSAAAQLFIDRAAAASPGYQPTEADYARIADICRRLDGLPLAIELAAARLRHMSLADLATRLGDRFRVLTGGSRSGPAHHRTLRATVEWSYELLAEEEKTLFERLSVFRNGFTLEAAETVAGRISEMEEVIDLLSGLVDKSLVLTERERAGPSRYRILKTLNEFGASRLAERPDEEETILRHAEYFADMADEVEPHLLGPDATRWTEWLRPEHGNLREALARCLRARNTTLALRLAAALALHWSRSGLLTASTSWLGRSGQSSFDVVATQTLEREIRMAWGETSPAAALEGLAGMVRADGDAHRAARLLGAADELRDRLDLEANIAEMTAKSSDVAAVRTALGGGIFAAEYERGRELVRPLTATG